MSRSAWPGLRALGLGLAMGTWPLAGCRPSVATEPPSAPPASPPPARPAAAPTHSGRALPTETDEPQPACAPAPEPFDDRAFLAEIDSLEQSLEGSPQAVEPRVEKGKPETDDTFAVDPLDEQERRLCSLYVRYVRDGAREDLRRDLRHRHLQLLMRHDYIDEAAEAAAAFVLDYPDHELAFVAVQMLVDALAIQSFVGDHRAAAWDRALEWIERLPTMPVWRHPQAEELHARVAMMRVGLLVARARAAREADPPDYEACARDYDAALEPNIGQPIDMLLLGAAECLELAGDLAGAEARYEELQRRFPPSERARP